MYRIGISGWTYGGWRGVFYPEELPQRRELEYATRCFNSIEINGSFYSLQRTTIYRFWRDQAPEDFVFAIKGGQYITHLRRLREVEEPLANFFASGPLALNEKLGPVLWQFPPQMKLDLPRFEHFFEILPKDTAEASKVACRHTGKVKGRTCLKSAVKQKIRYAVEIRHESFMIDEFFDLLRKYKIAFCFADTAGKWPYSEDITADFIYIRLHGAEQLYASEYSDAQLDWWAKRMKCWAAGKEPKDARKISPRKPAKVARDIYVYFDNDAKVKAPFDAARLAKRVGLALGHEPGTDLD